MKPATAKRKGAQTEAQACQWLREQGWALAEERRLKGAQDKGDVAGVPGICIEVKSAAAWAPVQWLRECTAETINADADIGFVMARPKGGTDVNNWVFMVTPATMVQLLIEAGRGPDPRTLLDLHRRGELDG